MAPFKYHWLDQASNSHTLENIGTGTYDVTVTDQAGCFVRTSVHVDEPDTPLAVSAVSTAPACYGQDNGMILIDARGGTSPYAYSVDDGNTYYETTAINAAVGDFIIVVRDHNGCTTSAETSVRQRNIRPEPNFLASSKQNAMDTLVLTDISVPKPDSIRWSFDANTIMLNNSEWTPEISVQQEGNYPVTMTGYFGDCAYEVTKTIFLRPFDPDAKPDDLPDASPIQFIEVTPNPSSGDFTVVVKLNKKRNLSLIVYSVVGNIFYENHYEETDSIEQYVNMSANAASGLYVVRAITDSDARDVRIVVNR